MKKIDFTNDERILVEKYLDTKKQANNFSKLEKSLKDDVIKLFNVKSHAMEGTEKTEKVYGTIRRDNKTVTITMATTTSKGRVDWETAFRDLWERAYGTTAGAEDFAETYRKPDSTSVSIKESK